MQTFLIVALLCASTVGPQDCTRATALDVVVSRTDSEITCMKGGEAVIAHAFAPLPADTYPLMRCERVKDRG